MLLNKYRNIIPNFNDPKAVVREYEDPSGNLVKIEVFYGGKYGGDSEGHGHWVAENIGGIMQVTLDRNPDKVDGGRHLIEQISKNDAYNGQARQERIRKKEVIISELAGLDYSDPDLNAKIKSMKERLWNCGSCGHYDNERLKKQFEEVADRLYNQRKEYRKEFMRQKEAIVSQAEILVYDTDCKKAKDEIRSLRDQMKQIPRGIKEEDDVLWTRFNQASDHIYENAKQAYEERKRKQQEAKIKKEEIAKEAERISYSTDFKAAKDQMRTLQEQWKQSPRAAKDDEDLLWERFRKAADRLYDNSKKDQEKRQGEQQATKRKKEQIISQAINLLGTSDYKSATNEMKRLSEEFFNAGSAGKDNFALKERFQSVKNRFFEAKKIASEQKHRAYVQSLYERLERKREALNRLESAIRNKEDQLSNIMSRPDPSYNNPHRWDIVARRNERESNIRSELTDMGTRRYSLINDIVELQSKFNNTF